MRFVVDAFSTLSSKPVNVKGLACARYICWWLSCEMPNYILPFVVFLAHFSISSRRLKLKGSFPRIFKWVASTQIHCELEIQLFYPPAKQCCNCPLPPLTTVFFPQQWRLQLVLSWSSCLQRFRNAATFAPVIRPFAFLSMLPYHPRTSDGCPQQDVR